MVLHVFVVLLVACLLFSLALFWRPDWLRLQPSHSRGGAKRSTLPRHLQPRTPDDCRACRMVFPTSSTGGPVPAPIRPWSVVKSRRGARQPVNTEGFACPNPHCQSCGNTDAHFQAAFRGWQARSC